MHKLDLNDLSIGELRLICANLQDQVAKLERISPIAMSFVPTDWRMIEKDTHYVLLQRNEVVATLAGPNAETNAATLALVLSGISHQGDQQCPEVPSE